MNNTLTAIASSLSAPLTALDFTIRILINSVCIIIDCIRNCIQKVNYLKKVSELIQFVESAS